MIGRRGSDLLAPGFFGLAVLLFVAAQLRPNRTAEGGGATTRNESKALQRADGLANYNFVESESQRWEMPKRLTEISGLAMSAQGTLLTHADEKGIVFELDPESGEILHEFALARDGETIRDDFEGIAVADSQIYLVTSQGRIYEFTATDEASLVAFQVHESGLGAACEIEGLAYETSTRALLLLCKKPLVPDLEGTIAIYRWSIDTGQTLEGATTSIALVDITSRIEEKNFQPSGIEVHPVSGHYFLVAARQAAVVEVTADGQVVATQKLKSKRHPQAEGITFRSDLSLLISDEGAGDRGQITIFSRSDESHR